jgi:hypothetical protein
MVWASMVLQQLAIRARGGQAAAAGRELFASCRQEMTRRDLENVRDCAAELARLCGEELARNPSTSRS